MEAFLGLNVGLYRAFLGLNEMPKKQEWQFRVHADKSQVDGETSKVCPHLQIMPEQVALIKYRRCYHPGLFATSNYTWMILNPKP